MIEKKPRDFYASDNLRFRKAMIRERLAENKAERDKLLSEKEEISQKLASSGATDKGASKATLGQLSNGLESARRLRFGFRTSEMA